MRWARDLAFVIEVGRCRLTIYLINISYITDFLPQHRVNIRKLISGVFKMGL